ncbi:uncharacterized protein LOC135367526 [Ornithodoros turicata]|uniref:uncharacterized protein LOC135367526 n=1 Tax=Ornithodoros turicata TaxID=34597 RepID=UPI003139271C
MNFAGLLPPSTFLPTPGEPSSPWEQWKQSFLTFLKAVDGDGYPPARKRAILLHCLGAEGQRIFHSLEPSNAQSSSTVTTAPTSTTTLTTDIFTGALSHLDKRFGAQFEEEAIKQQLLEGTRMQQLRERLLVEGQAFTLEKAVNLATTIAAATSATNEFLRPYESRASVEATDAADVQRVDGKPKRSLPHKSSQPQPSSGNRQSKQTPACYRCGSCQHLAK